METCVVVIPVYKANPLKVERASFKQGISVLRKHPICLVTYKELDISFYQNEARKLGVPLSVEYFDKEFFSSRAAYNTLCLTPDFYVRFQNYEYMHIYQLDAWVFRDELLEWCGKGYDFIGAPWFYWKSKKDGSDKYRGVGNGGFSLRKISYCLTVINSDSKKVFLRPDFLMKELCAFYTIKNKDKSWWKHAIWEPFKFVAKCFGVKNTLRYALKRIHEDRIFGLYAANSWQFTPKLPSKEEAKKFSFEVHPSALYAECGNQLPFGCHGFERYEYDSFWSQFIKI